MAKRLYITLGLIGFLTVTVSSQVVRPIGLLGPLKNWTSETPAGEALIKGAAVDMNNTPLANAPVRLRNLLSNKIEQSSFADQAGEFTFLARPEVPYVVEIADQAGLVIAVGDIITAQAGDVAGAIVTIPSKLPSLAGVFGESMGSVASAAHRTRPADPGGQPGAIGLDASRPRGLEQGDASEPELRRGRGVFLGGVRVGSDRSTCCPHRSPDNCHGRCGGPGTHQRDGG